MDPSAGGTAGLAAMIGDALTEAGIEVSVSPARAMAKTKAGDWRVPAQVRRWVAAIVEQLQAAQPSGG